MRGTLKIAVLSVAAVIGIVILLATVAFVIKRKPDIPLEVLKSEYADSNSHYARLPGRIIMHYREIGNRNAPAVLFIHGLGGSSLSWKSWDRALERDFHLFELDLPGHGLTSAPPDWRPSPEAYASAVESFALTRKLDRFSLIGASFGGQVAWTYSVRYPRRVAKLVLISSSGWPEEHSPKALALLRQPWMMPLLSQIDTTSRFGEALRTTYSDPSKVSDATVKRFADFSRAPGHRRIIFTTTGSLPLFSPATPDRLAKIVAPTLIIHGRRDTRVPVANAMRFHRAISGSKLIIYQDAGHAVSDEFSARATRDALRFLNDHPEHR